MHIVVKIALEGEHVEDGVDLVGDHADHGGKARPFDPLPIRFI